MGYTLFAYGIIVSSLVGATAGRSSSFLSRALCLADGSRGSREWCRGLSVGY